MRSSRRRLLRVTAQGLAAGALAAPSLPRFAHAAEFTWRLGHTAPATFPLHQRLLGAASEIAEASGGRMSVTVSPERMLGDQMGQLAQVRNGTLDATVLGGQILSGTLPAVAVASVGFAFGSWDRVWAAMDGGLGKAIRATIEKQIGVQVMETVWDFGFRHITTATKPVHVAADVAGLRIRTPPERDFIVLFRALKAIPFPIEIANLRQALQSGTIDGQEGVLILVQMAALADLQSYCALTHHVWDRQYLCVASQSWKRLPDELKQIAATAFDAAAVLQRHDSRAADDAIQAALTTKGMAFNTVDPASFRATLRDSGYYRDARKRVGDAAWQALEEYSGALT